MILWIILEDAFWSALAALGFGFLFNVPRRALWGCAVTGAIGHASRRALLEMGWGVELSTLMCAILMGVVSFYFARYFRAPALVFSVTGAIPLAPGGFAYRAMIGFIELTYITGPESQLILTEAVVNLFRTTLVLGAIALGISLPTLLFRRPDHII
jgi:uncharacterized membrane protein YjjB (DUF3815 family)